jgi:hypothetical protein
MSIFAAVKNAVLFLLRRNKPFAEKKFYVGLRSCRLIVWSRPKRDGATGLHVFFDGRAGAAPYPVFPDEMEQFLTQRNEWLLEILAKWPPSGYDPH